MGFLKSHRKQEGENGHLVCGKMRQKLRKSLFYIDLQPFWMFDKKWEKLQKNAKKCENMQKMGKNARFLSKN